MFIFLLNFRDNSSNTGEKRFILSLSSSYYCLSETRIFIIVTIILKLGWVKPLVKGLFDNWYVP